MPPSGDGYTVDIEALRADATTWSTSAQTLREAGAIAHGLHLEPMAFSYPGIWAGLAATYQSLQDKLSRLLGEGADSMTSIANRLTVNADNYEHAETAAVHAMTATGSRLPGYRQQGGSR